MQYKEYDSYANKPKGLASLLAQLQEKFTVVYTDTLFTPVWEALKESKCPLCGNKIYKMQNKPLWHCKSFKHRTFVIKDVTLQNLLIEFKKNDIPSRSTYVKRLPQLWNNKIGGNL